jgi:hypothetical protein
VCVCAFVSCMMFITIMTMNAGGNVTQYTGRSGTKKERWYKVF